jgi:uracil-DNA glycosylase family 4
MLPKPEACVACPLSIDGEPKTSVLAIGSSKPKFIIIGEGPGREEVKNGQPFVGLSGRILSKALRQLGIDRDDLFITNASLCYPNDKNKKEDDVEQACDCCKDRLYEELRSFGPTPILLVGAHASKRFLGNKFKVTELAGSYNEIVVPGIDLPYPAIPTVHPAAFVRNGTGDTNSGGAHAGDLAYWSFLYDLAKVKALSEGKKVVTPDVRMEWLDSNKAELLIEQFCRDARVSKSFACDTETKGVPYGECQLGCYSCQGHSALEAMHAKLKVIGLATEEYAISVNWSIISERSFQMLAKLFGDETLTCIFHNRGYDEVVLTCHGLKISNHIECTLFMDHNAFPGLGHGLQRVANRFMLLKAWKAEHKRAEGKDGIAGLLEYCGQDTLNTARLVKPLKAIIKRNKAEQTYEMDMHKAEIAAKMQLWGIPIDLERNQRMAEFFVPRIREAEHELRGMIVDDAFKTKFFDSLAVEKAKRKRKLDPDDFILRHAMRLEEAKEEWEELNLNSRDEIVAFLKACGVPLVLVTEKGNVSTKKDVLENLVSHSAVRHLLQYREMEKLYGTFIEPIPHHIYADGRVHPTWKPLAISGRFKSSPNWQNHSKGESAAINYATWCKIIEQGSIKGFEEKFPGWSGKLPTPNLRWQVRAKPGRMLVGCDFSALEARIVALLAGDEWLVNAFNKDFDIHSFNAEQVWPHFKSLVDAKGKRTSEGKMLRDIIKSTFYAFVYGALPTTAFKQIIQAGANVSLKQINTLFIFFKKQYPKIAIFHAELFRKVLQEHRVSSFIFGRSRWFPLDDFGITNETVIKNFTCQAAGADIRDIGLWNLYQRLPEFNNAMIIIDGHDAVVTEVDENETDKMALVLQQTMAQEFTHNGLTAKFAVEPGCGDWAET